MIYERFPQLHQLSKEEKAQLGRELLEVASRQEPQEKPAPSKRMEPDWKIKARISADSRQGPK